MTRDMDLIRGILLAIEENETLGGCRFSEILEWLQAKEYIATSDEDKVSAHCGILVDGGLIEKCYDYYESHASRQDKWFFFSSSKIRLCWEGHEFLDNARQDRVWNKVQGHIANAGGTLSFEIIKSLVTQYSKSVVGL